MPAASSRKLVLVTPCPPTELQGKEAGVGQLIHPGSLSTQEWFKHSWAPGWAQQQKGPTLLKDGPAASRAAWGPAWHSPVLPSLLLPTG